MKWDEACNASINGKAKRDNDEEIWLIIDRDSVRISYEINNRGIGSRSTGERGPVARVLLAGTDDNGVPILRTKKMIDVTVIEKFDDWRPSVPRLVVEEIEDLDDLDILDDLEGVELLERLSE